MLNDENTGEKLAAPLARKSGIKRESFQKRFRGSKVVGAGGAPLPVYHASPTTAPLQPKSCGTAGEHSYFYFAVSSVLNQKFDE